MIPGRIILILLFLAAGLSPLYAEETLQLNDAQPQFTLADANVPNNDNSLNVNDLGFTQADLQSDLSQKDLDARSDMLHIHQILGLVTEASLITTFVTGLITEDNVSNGSTDTSLVSYMGYGTLALYSATASFAIFAPKPKDNKPTGNTALHEILVWIHLPLMILVPITGDMIGDEIAANQPVGALGAIHGIMATALLLSYTTSLVVVTF